MSEHIQIKLFANLNRLMPTSPNSFPISPPVTVAQVLLQLKVPLSQAKLIFVNSQRAELSTTLKDGDRLGVFPPVGGG